MPVIVGGKQLVSEFPFELGRESLKRTDDGTTLMNVDGRPSGTSTIIWNGTGASDTGGDWTAGGSGSETSGSMHSGTNGWDSGTVGANNETTFTNGSEIDVAGIYSQLEFWLQPKAYPGNANLQLQWRNNANTVIGMTLNVENYVTNMDLDVWQKVTVPVADFNLTANVSKLWVVYKVGTQQHYLDDIALVQSGGDGPFTFELGAPDANSSYHVSMIVVLISAPESGWNSDAFANIAGGLDSGLICRQFVKSTSETIWTFNTKNNLQLFGQYHPQESFTFADGNLLVGFMVKPGKASIVLTDDEVLQFVVQDDLSSISEMRSYCHYGVEVL